MGVENPLFGKGGYGVTCVTTTLSEVLGVLRVTRGSRWEGGSTRLVTFLVEVCCENGNASMMQLARP